MLQGKSPYRRGYCTRCTPARIAPPPIASAFALEGLEPRALLSVFSVINTNDSGPGSLHQAIQDANAAAGADEIQFTGSVFTDPTPDTITVGDLQLIVTDSLKISGPGANLLSISGNNLKRHLYFSAGVSQLIGVTITAGNSQNS